MAGLFKTDQGKNNLDAVLGGVFKLCPVTTFKAKYCLSGILGLSVKRSVDKTTSVVVAAEVPVSNPTEYKFGITTTLG